MQTSYNLSPSFSIFFPLSPSPTLLLPLPFPSPPLPITLLHHTLSLWTLHSYSPHVMPLSLKDPNYQARVPLAAICKSTLTFFLHLTILRALALSPSVSLSVSLSLFLGCSGRTGGPGQERTRTTQIILQNFTRLRAHVIGFWNVRAPKG